MIKATDARKATDKVELKRIETTLDDIYEKITTLSSTGCDYLNYNIGFLSRKGQKAIKRSLKAEGYRVNLNTSCVFGEEYLHIEW